MDEQSRQVIDNIDAEIESVAERLRKQGVSPAIVVLAKECGAEYHAIYADKLRKLVPEIDVHIHLWWPGMKESDYGSPSEFIAP